MLNIKDTKLVSLYLLLFILFSDSPVSLKGHKIKKITFLLLNISYFLPHYPYKSLSLRPRNLFFNEKSR